jgi:hypothetical protein
VTSEPNSRIHMPASANICFQKYSQSAVLHVPFSLNNHNNGGASSKESKDWGRRRCVLLGEGAAHYSRCSTDPHFHPSLVFPVPCSGHHFSMLDCADECSSSHSMASMRS